MKSMLILITYEGEQLYLLGYVADTNSSIVSQMVRPVLFDADTSSRESS
jgi:hypothetical protein